VCESRAEGFMFMDWWLRGGSDLGRGTGVCASLRPKAWELEGMSPKQGSFLGCMQPESTKNLISLYKNSRIFLDEKAKCQPWIIKKSQNLDDEEAKIG
jgi:hypothetical protein